MAIVRKQPSGLIIGISQPLASPSAQNLQVANRTNKTLSKFGIHP